MATVRHRRTRTLLEPSAAVGSNLHLTDRFQFDSRTGPPFGARLGIWRLTLFQ